jgi:hypothetical protein
VKRRTATRITFAAAALAAVMLISACGSASSPGPTSAGGSGNGPSSAVSSGQSSTGPASQPASVAPPSSTEPGSATGAKARPVGDPCTWLDKATIDATLGLDVGAAIPNTGDAKGKICTWLSKAPAGGLTLSLLDKGVANGLIPNYAKLPGGRLVPGLGLGAAASFLGGQKSPLPKTHANLFVDFGDWGLSVDISGATMTVDLAAALAVAVVQ